MKKKKKSQTRRSGETSWQVELQRWVNDIAVYWSFQFKNQFAIAIEKTILSERGLML